MFTHMDHTQTYTHILSVCLSVCLSLSLSLSLWLTHSVTHTHTERQKNTKACTHIQTHRNTNQCVYNLSPVLITNLKLHLALLHTDGYTPPQCMQSVRGRLTLWSPWLALQVLVSKAPFKRGGILGAQMDNVGNRRAYFSPSATSQHHGSELQMFSQLMAVRWLEESLRLDSFSYYHWCWH